MSNERYNQIIDDAHNNYIKETWFGRGDTKWVKEVDGMNMRTGEKGKVYRQFHKDEFVNKCKTDTEFSEKWGLKIEERELSLEERHQIHTDNVSKLNGMPMYVIYDGPESERVNFYDEENIPTKLITVTYKDEKIEVYE